jgi:hypothetical protein
MIFQLLLAQITGITTLNHTTFVKLEGKQTNVIQHYTNKG